tara:strand:- start:602 stop:1165 length:564 start_codon:yes stop_codon:yes gene_type:complete
MTVAGLAIEASNRSPIILLRDPSGRRQVPIWINHEQAHNIVAGYQKSEPARPLTHDLIVSLLSAGKMQLERVIINEMGGNSFYALLMIRITNVIKKNSQKKSYDLLEIKARPSDAIALAIRTKCSIWMVEKVFAEASIPVDEKADTQDQDEFRRFLDDLRPSDLIRHLKKGDQSNENPIDFPNSDVK